MGEWTSKIVDQPAYDVRDSAPFRTMGNVTLAPSFPFYWFNIF